MVGSHGDGCNAGLPTLETSEYHKAITQYLLNTCSLVQKNSFMFCVRLSLFRNMRILVTRLLQ